MSNESVNVALRVRPLINSETSRGCQNIIQKTTNQPQVLINCGTRNDMFTFNHVFAPEETQEMLYENSVKPLIKKLFQGYNVTILAYGQTGSGKTHTMGTAYNGCDDEETGVIPRAVTEIFDKIEIMSDYSFTVHCSFMELYQEQLFDLLSDNQREQSVVDIREDANKEIFIPNLTELMVTSAHQTTDYLIRGSNGRVVGATAMNATSSRSHAIFTVTIQMMKTGDANSSTRSRFHLVDLAGSERSKKTKATGERFKEGVKINQGLLALGNVISALGSNQNNAYIGYRDSKLTRLLQDSLGGNSVTLMIACISPADYNLEETISTLRYADRAKQIKNKPVINQDPKTAEINRLNVVIQKLRMDLLNRTNISMNLSSGTAGGNLILNEQLEKLRHELQLAINENANLRKKLEYTLHDAANMEHRFNEAEQLNDALYTNVIELKEKIINLNTTFNIETCPAEFYLHAKAVGEAKNMILNLEDLINKNNENMNDSNATVANGNVSDLEENDEVNRKIDAFTSKQVVYRDELNDIKQQLAIKEVLHKKIFGNYSDLCSYEDIRQTDGKIKDYEFIIQNLEREKEDLLKEMAKSNQSISAKLAEERRRKVLQLENEINETKKKNKQQAILLKQKEKDSQKILQLQNDISAMKQKKVKLIRTMKNESEDFRRWKLNREREITMLKEKDRKRQHEMIKKDMLFKKQSNVLKRKIEESMAVNKRLKEALEKHQKAQANRKKTTIVNGKVDHIAIWIDQELDIIISVIDAKQSLEQLVEDRGDLNIKLNNLKKNKFADKNEVETIQEEVEMRNAQIADLREKIDAFDVDAKTKTICDGMQSMPEARTALKHLFHSISELRTEYMATLTKFNDLKLNVDANEEKLLSTENHLKQQIEALKAEKNLCEKEYEEKIATLLGVLNNKANKNDENDVVKIKEDAFETLREKLEAKTIEVEELKNLLDKKKPKSALEKIKKELVVEYHNDSYVSEDAAYDDDDDDNDPDWHKTPLKREKSITRKKKEEDVTLATTISDTTTNSRKRGSSDASHSCSCKGDCMQRRCGCKRNGIACKENCKCAEACKNTTDNDTTYVTSSSTNAISDIENDQTKANESNTPKKMKLNTTDILTPSYPYEFKTKRPLLQ